VDDGIRISFNVSALTPITNAAEEGDNVPTFDTTSNQGHNYAQIFITATAYAGEKALVSTTHSLYRSNNQWSPSVNALLNNPTNDSIYLSNALSKTEQVMGGSQLYDAIVLAADRINQWQLNNSTWNSADKIIFVLTDGGDNLSQYNIDQVSQRIKMISTPSNPAFMAMILFGDVSQSEYLLAEKLISNVKGAMITVPIGYDPAQIPALISSLFTKGAGYFNSGTYTGTINIGEKGKFSQACVNINLPTGSTATFSARFSNDNNSWSIWTIPTPISFSGNTCIPIPSTECQYMQFAIQMVGNESFVSPVLAEVTSTYYKPSTDVVFLQPIAFDTSGNKYASELVVTQAGTIPDGASVSYSATNFETQDAKDYITSSKPGFVANERAFVSTRFNEPTVTTNNVTYTAINGSWPSEAIVNVYVILSGQTDGQLADSSSYTLNNQDGTVTFSPSLVAGSRVVLDIHPDGVLRVAMYIKNYSNQPVELGQLTVMFNKTTRVQTYPDGTIKRHPMGDDLDNSSSSSSSESSESSQSGA
jgi:hypothetical protein